MTGMQPQMLMEQMRPEAEKQIRTRLVLEAVAKAENITASEEDIKAEIEKMAEMYHMDVDKLKESMDDREKEYISTDIEVRKAVDLLVSESVEVDVPAEEE